MRLALANEEKYFELNFDRDLTLIDINNIIENNFALKITVGLELEMRRSFDLLKKKLQDPEFRIYGVNTGFGQNAKSLLDFEENTDLQNNLIEYLNCGFGPTTDFYLSKLTLLFRIINFSKGFSGISPDLFTILVRLYNANIIPVIPKEGSLGASGDLIPMAAIGGCLQGEGECYLGTNEKIISAQEALNRLNLRPFQFSFKDGLGLVNGTSLMSAISFSNLKRLESMVNRFLLHNKELFKALDLNQSFLSPLLHEKTKPHPGQVYTAGVLRTESQGIKDIEHNYRAKTGEQKQPMQYPYSLRCVPQVLGPLLDFLNFSKSILVTEINSVNDNPIVGEDKVFSGGNFYGGHIAMINDGLKGPLSQMASLVDRQVLLFCDDRTNFGLPMNLADSGKSWDHGLKGLHQYCTSLFCELNQGLTISAGQTRSTETHNQDIISMGTHAARQVDLSLDLLEKMLKIHEIMVARVCKLKNYDTSVAALREVTSIKERLKNSGKTPLFKENTFDH